METRQLVSGMKKEEHTTVAIFQEKRHREDMRVFFSPFIIKRSFCFYDGKENKKLLLNLEIEFGPKLKKWNKLNL